MLNKEKIITYIQWLILLLLFSYDWFTYLPETVNFAFVKSVYYIFIFFSFASLSLLQIKAGKIQIQRIGIVSLFLQIYIWLYLIRLCMDFLVNGVEQSIVTNPYAAVFLYANAAIVPYYGLHVFRWDLINIKELNKAILCVFMAMGLLSIYYILTGNAAEYIGSDGRFRGNASMDTIAFGHLGTSIFLLAISYLCHASLRLLDKMLIAFSVIIGLIIAVAAGSRGAIVALIICLVIYLYIKGHKTKIIIGLPILALVLIAILPSLNDIFISHDNYAVERLYTSIYDPDSMGDSGVTSGRDELYEDALNIIEDNYITGSSFFLGGRYVHNSILESFLGLGFLGGIIFLSLITSISIVAIRLSKKNKCYLFISLLFIQYLSYSLFSRTLSMLPLFWLSMYLVLNLNAFEQKKSIIND